MRTRERTLFGGLGILAALAIVGTTLLVTAPQAAAHGAPMAPGSRTYLCWRDGLTETGQIIPNNPACAAAVAENGADSLYNWFSVLRSDAGGRTVGYIADGDLCSGGNPKFSGYDAARADWPVTHLTSGARFDFRYSNWAHHPGTFYLYVTKDGWTPDQPLGWDDLEQFATVTDPPQNGGPGTNDGHYYWTATLPSGKSGQHIIYMRWVRSDSQENFFSCSDVVFDGGNGEVTGIGPGAGGPGGPGEPGTELECEATFGVVNPWDGGFQGEVTVTNPNGTTLRNWTVNLTLDNGQTVQSMWNGTYEQQGSVVVIRSTGQNGAIGPRGSVTVGFVANGTVPNDPALTCTGT